MNEVMMVPVQEFNRLQDYYKGQISQNALLNKAGRLAAEEHLILKDKRIPDSMAVKMTKPIATEESKLVKRIRTGKSGPISYQGNDRTRRHGRRTRRKSVETDPQGSQQTTRSPRDHQTRTTFHVRS